MKFNFLWFLVASICFNFLPLKAQYIHQNTFPSEQQRRQQYALDDWISYLESKYISSMTVGAEYIYFSTFDGGILRYHLYQNYWDYPYTTSNGLPSNRVLDVFYDEGTGFLWAITDVDTCIFRPAEKEWVCKSQANYWSHTFPQRELPNAGKRVEFNIFYPADFLNKLPNYFVNGPYSLTGDWVLIDDNFQEYPISGFLRDRYEHIWFAIDGLGIGIGDTYSQRIDIVPLGLSHISPRVIQFQDNDLWIGGTPFLGEGLPGITNWRNQDGGWYYYYSRYIPELPSDDVVDIEVHNDSVWFATNLGVSLYDTRENEWKNFREKEGIVNQIVNDLFVHGNKLYVGTHGGLNTIDLKTEIVKRIKDVRIKLADIYEIDAQQDTIYVATNRGIYKWYRGAPEWMPVESSSPIQTIPALAVESFNREMWFSSPEGVFWLDTQKNEWEAFPELGREIQGPFFDLEVNSNSVWVSTPDGLLKYDRERNYWILFTVEDGLLANECHRLLLDGDYIWIANRLGITQFYWNNPNRID